MAYSPKSSLPDDQVGVLVAILDELRLLNSNSGQVDPASKRLQVDVLSNAALPDNQSTNLSRVNDATVLTNAGASGPGAQRITPANDTLAGIPSVYLVQQGQFNAPLSLLYNAIQTS